MPLTILVVSKKSDLADFRAQVLSDAGYRVESAMDLITFINVCERTPKVDLVMIGHSLPVLEKRRVSEAAKEACKGIPILELYEQGQHALLENEFVHECHTASDFLVAVNHILGFPASAPIVNVVDGAPSAA